MVTTRKRTSLSESNFAEFMAFAKDHIAFLYVHQENGEVVFTSKGASHFCPIPGGHSSFKFEDLMAAQNSDSGSVVNFMVFKEQTRREASSMNRYFLPLLGQNGSTWNAYVCEMFIAGGYHGVVFTQAAEGVDYLAALLISKGAHARAALLSPSVSSESLCESTTALLVEVFEKNLIHFPKHDQWYTSGGRERFAEQVRFHVRKNIPLELVLPAFPVKSCNTRKVIGKQPDKGEELAIHSMKIVADKVKAIYHPGVHFNVVSDGHVFSDLVGVDDASVDTYGHMFRKMAADLYPGLVTFYGLDDFLFLDGCIGELSSTYMSLIQETGMEHPIQTTLTDRAEIARKLMKFLFGSDESALRHEIETEPETMALYSGFERFMLEDLAHHETCKSLSSNASRKKLCSRVGFLMIQRNRAYSTMVEWLFPIQLRISIHPHPNRGPKYGINVIHPSFVAVQRDSNEKLFHTPTPWQNAVVEMSDGKFLLMPSAAILASGNIVINGEVLQRVELQHYPDGRPSHFKQIIA